MFLKRFVKHGWCKEIAWFNKSSFLLFQVLVPYNRLNYIQRKILLFCKFPDENQTPRSKNNTRKIGSLARNVASKPRHTWPAPPVSGFLTPPSSWHLAGASRLRKEAWEEGGGKRIPAPGLEGPQQAGQAARQPKLLSKVTHSSALATKVIAAGQVTT